MVSVPNTIAFSDECWIRVLNTSDNFTFLPTNTLKMTKIDEYNIFMTKQVNKNQPENGTMSKNISTLNIVSHNIHFSDIRYS